MNHHTQPSIEVNEMNTSASVLQRPKNRKVTLPQVIDAAVLASFVVSVVYLVFQVAQGNMGVAATATSPERDYKLMLLQCVAGIVAIHIPLLLNKFLRLQIPKALHIMFSAFLFCAIFLGEVANFYYLIPNWDDVLHLTSGMMLCLLGCMLANIMARKQQLPPALIAVFGLCFAIAVGGLWEVYEYAFDGLLGLNMQKTVLQSGEVLAGHAAITDTIIDIVVDSVGAVAGAILGYQAAGRGKNWITGGIRHQEDNAIYLDGHGPQAA